MFFAAYCAVHTEDRQELSNCHGAINNDNYD